MKTHLVLLLVLALAVNVTARGEITLPAIIGNNMVLQQRSEAPFWGKARSHATVKGATSWDHVVVSVPAAADGSWRVLVETPSAGGPYTITLEEGAGKMVAGYRSGAVAAGSASSGSPKLVLTNVLIGEVWVCSGQSIWRCP